MNRCESPAPGGSVTEHDLLGEGDIGGFDFPVVRVAIIDYSGDLVSEAEDFINVGLPTEGGSLDGDTGVRAINGEANFTRLLDPETSAVTQEGLSIDIPIGCAALTDVGLTASVDNVDQVNSEPFDVDADC